MSNPFKVGDRVLITNQRHPHYHEKITIIGIDGDDIHYGNGHIIHYKSLKLVQPAPEPPLLHQKWKDLYDNGTVLQCSFTNNSGGDSWFSIGSSTSLSGSFNESTCKYRVTLTSSNSTVYPIYAKWKHSTRVVKFTALTTGVTVVASKFSQIGSICTNLIPHTDNKDWKLLPNYKEEATLSLQETLNQIPKSQETPMQKLALKILLGMMAMLSNQEETKDATNSNHVAIITDSDNDYVDYIYFDKLEEATQIMQQPENEGRKLHIFDYSTTLAQKPRKVISVERV